MVTYLAGTGADGVNQQQLNTDEVKLITFDCYGTLVDWESGIRAALDVWG